MSITANSNACRKDYCCLVDLASRDMVSREKENLEQQDRETCRLASGKTCMELAAVGSAQPRFRCLTGQSMGALLLRERETPQLLQ